jgi:beta-hydroxylase
MPATAYKILTADQWAAFQHNGEFTGAPVDLADGYIHLSTADQLGETLTKHFAGQTNLIIAEIDLTMLVDTVRWEVSRGDQLFPHIYGVLPMTAVRGTVAR